MQTYKSFETTVGKELMALTHRFHWMLSENWDGTPEGVVKEVHMRLMESLNASYRAKEECGKVAKERDAYKRQLDEFRRELECKKAYQDQERRMSGISRPGQQGALFPWEVDLHAATAFPLDIPSPMVASHASSARSSAGGHGMNRITYGQVSDASTRPQVAVQGSGTDNGINEEAQFLRCTGHARAPEGVTEHPRHLQVTPAEPVPVRALPVSLAANLATGSCLYPTGQKTQAWNPEGQATHVNVQERIVRGNGREVGSPLLQATYNESAWCVDDALHYERPLVMAAPLARAFHPPPRWMTDLEPNATTYSVGDAHKAKNSDQRSNPSSSTGQGWAHTEVDASLPRGPSPPGRNGDCRFSID